MNATMQPCPLCNATGDTIRGTCTACDGEGEISKFVKMDVTLNDQDKLREAVENLRELERKA